MKKISLFFAALFLYLGSAYAQEKKMWVQVNIDLSFKNKDGADLLGSSFVNDSIVVYNIVEGKKIKVNKPHADYPNNHFTFYDKATQSTILRVFLEEETTLLQLNAKTTDTIKCSLKKEKGAVHLYKVWYNGKLKYKFGKGAPGIITVLYPTNKCN
ncbi:MAG: hypothetical protein JST67_11290 [Bacteroidetes bacterium]|nr:hypothetical protein [Bacteroidota bacterium]